MFDNLQRTFCRAANQPRWWIGLFGTAILATTAAAIVCHAPFAAYVIIFVVAVMVVFAADGHARRAHD